MGVNERLFFWLIEIKNLKIKKIIYLVNLWDVLNISQTDSRIHNIIKDILVLNEAGEIIQRRGCVKSNNNKCVVWNSDTKLK